MKPWLRTLLGVALLLFGLGAAGAVYQLASGERELRAHPAPGRMVDIGGYRLHLYCLGDGAPVVIMDAGLGDSWLTWTRVQPELSASTRVCSYDRAGIGYSELGPFPRDSRRIVQELHSLLQKANLPGPYVLVGHSFGGFNVRLYTYTYPAEVAGLVLVDASHEDQTELFPDAVRQLLRDYRRTVRLQIPQALMGLTRMRGISAADPGAVPSEARQQVEPIGYRTAWYRTTLAELESFGTVSAAEVRHEARQLEIPLEVVTGSTTMAAELAATGMAKADADSAARVWQELQRREALMSSQGHQTIAGGSSHYVMNDRPELVIQAVQTVVEELRGIEGR